MAVSRGGLRLVFDPGLDGAAWPSVLADRPAAFGEAWCGPLNLLARLETELGLLADAVPPVERALDLAAKLATRPGFWSPSLEVDSLATAARLLEDRDRLGFAGWRGQSLGPRLDALWAATVDAAPGVPDRLRRVIELLPRRPMDIASIALIDDPLELPRLWRELFVALGSAGVTIERRILATATATGDLQAARGAGFVPTGDGSLTLVRPHGPVAAADEIAASLAALPSLDGVVIIAPDEILDAALARHGLPRVGQPRGATAASALVRLVVAAAFSPADPDDIHALICADPGPVNRALKGRLVRALGRFPARGSTDWTEALAEGLSKIEDETERTAIAARVAALVDPAVTGDASLPLEALEKRLRVLATWAHGRAASVPTLRVTAVFADRLVRLARRTGETAFSRTRLRRLLDELEPPVLAGAAAEVGIASVASPAAIVGPARVIIWWNFTRESAPSASRLRLTSAEREAMVAAKIEPPAAGREMGGEARRWRRPLEMASEHLVLVCPRNSAGAEHSHPHPLWDELVAQGGNAAVLTRASAPFGARRERVELRPLVVAAARATGPVLEVGDTASPSSMESLLACSMQWVLERRGKIYDGHGTGPGAPSPLFYGNIAHKVLEHVFGQPVASAEEAAARAGAEFDASLPRFAEAMLLPHYQTNRAELRRGIVESAREVAKFIESNGATVQGMEVELEGEIDGIVVKGRADMVLAAPNVVIDFKWGKKRYRDALRSGTAFQLAAYAVMMRERTRKLPEVAYLTLSRQDVMAPAGTKLKGARSSSDYTTQDMIDGAVVRLRQRRDELAAGVIEAPSALEDVKGDHIGGAMHIPPKCEYCSFGAVCGRSMRA